MSGANDKRAGDKTEAMPAGALDKTVVDGAPGGAPKMPLPTPTQTGHASKTQPTGEAAKKISRLGNFTIKKKLGEGGMGAVYLAHQENLDRTCALKVMNKKLSAKEDFVKRFQREARSMAKIDHPNVVRVYDVGEEHGIHYVAMEFINGKSVQDYLDAVQKFSLGDALHVTILVAEALGHAHKLNMVHRDVKPDNILITNRGEVKLADLGLAKQTDEEVSMTQSGTGLGTPLYMAPEQARNAKHVDGRCDIYALGCTLYHLLTGKLPFAGDSTLQLILEKEKGKFKPASQVVKGIPERLDLILDKTMAKDPTHRYATCEELVADLESLGVISEALTFVNSDEKVIFRRGSITTVSSMGAKLPPTRKSTAEPAKTSSEDAASQRASRQPNQTWFVRYLSDEDKKLKNAKLTGPQLLQAIKGDKIPLQTLVASREGGEYLPLAQVPLFSEEALKMKVRQETKLRNASLANKFAKIDRQHKWQKVWRKFAGIKDGAVGGLSLIIWLAFVGLVIAGIYFVYPYVLEFMAEKLGIEGWKK